MFDGTILRDFIDGQKVRKQKIADDLKMTRSNLYQLFESKTITDENKKKFEDYFGTKIFSEEMFIPRNKNLSQQKESEDKEPLERAIENLTQADLINARSIERLIALLEHKLNVSPGGLLPQPGGDRVVDIRENSKKSQPNK